MKKICIAGAGPGGLLLGKELAKAGMDVTVFEACTEEQFYKKFSWSDALEISMLQDAELPVPESKGDRWVGYGVKGQNTGLDLYENVRQAELGIYSPDYSEHTVTDVDFRYIFVDRTALQRFQLKQTLEAGCKVVFGARVVDLLGTKTGKLGDVCVKGVVVEKDGVREEIEADLVVEATGQACKLRSMLEPIEISQPFNANQYGKVLKKVAKVKTTQGVKNEVVDLLHPPFRNHYRLRNPRGYLFFHLHSENEIEVGGGAVSEEEAVKNIMGVLENIPGYTGEIVGGNFEKNIKCLPPDCLVATGFIVIGHAGAQIHPTHGCGISTAYMGALLAAQIIKRAKDFSIETLWEYNYRWMSTQGAHFAALFNRLKGMETDEVSFLIKHNIINAETFTNDYNGNYLPPNVNEIRRLEDVYPLNPELIEKWMQAEEESRRNFVHYSAYPPVWNPFALARWRAASPNK